MQNDKFSKTIGKDMEDAKAKHELKQQESNAEQISEFGFRKPTSEELGPDIDRLRTTPLDAMQASVDFLAEISKRQEQEEKEAQNRQAGLNPAKK